MDDPSSGTLLLLSLLGFLLVCSGCFSATETAFFCLDRIERRRLAGEKSKRSRLIVALLKRPRELLSTVLFGNTLVNVATAVTAALLFARVFDTHSLWIAVVVDTLLVLFFGEIIPKTIAVNKAPAVARIAIIPFHFFSTVSRPMVIVFDRLARIILRFLRVPEEARDALSPAELEVLFEEADQEATITSQERRIASNILRFSQTTAHEIMTPRVDIVATPLDVSRDTLGKLMIEARHSRIPVYEQSLDYIVGFVGSKEFFLNPERKISELVNPVSIFPEGAKINHIFRYMQKNLLNMAVIVDEYGVTAGIATMEDLLEEIVGEIYDEYEKAEELIRKEALDTWFVLARAPVEQVNKACGLFLPEGESVTLNGYLSNEFGRIPVPEETIERGGALFTIVESKRGHIVSCRIRLMIPEEHRNDL
ncbi:MAG: HlyC/CorC family transporter [Deltaproteobacteria bacterium]|nr:HlyC/CorC family transporter [Deltaproteobacteria bacterium]